MAAAQFELDWLSRIEDASLNASAPPQQLWLDGWLVRLCPGKAKRARSINAVAAGRRPVQDKLAEARRHFDAAGLPLVVRITPFTQPADLDAQLAAAGMQRFDDTCVMVAPAGMLQLQEAWPADMDLRPVDSMTFADAVGGLRGSTDEQRQAHVQRLQQSPVPYQGWLMQRCGELLACGQTATEGRFVGVYDVFTAPAARNQGLARALCAEMLRRARDAAGGIDAYLQVDAANHPARAVYRRLGFVDGYGYHYRADDPSVG